MIRGVEVQFGQRWVEQLVERYNAFGPGVLCDLRRDNDDVLASEETYRKSLRALS
jgi:hypothetical protein